MTPEAAPDVWDNIVARLNERGVGPIAFGDLTYPQLIAILTDGKSGEADEGDKTRSVLADFKAGRISF